MWRPSLWGTRVDISRPLGGCFISVSIKLYIVNCLGQEYLGKQK